MDIVSKNVLFCSLLFGSITLYGQTSTISGGGTSKSNNGSISYSLGIVSYIQLREGSVNISQGVQHPFEIYLISKNEFENLYFIYPNPTNDLLYIIEKNYGGENWKYLLVDVNGKVLEHNVSSSNKIRLSLHQYNSGVYYLHIENKNKKNICSII